MNPVSARFPSARSRRSSPIRSSISRHSAPVRWSFQRIAGRITRSAGRGRRGRASAPRGRSPRPPARRTPPRGRRGGEPPGLGILLRPARAAGSRAVAARGDGEDRAVGRERERLDAGGADVEADQRLGMGLPASRSRAERGVHELVGAHCVLARLRLAQRGVVDPAGDVPDEAPLLDAPRDGRDGVLGVRVEVEARGARRSSP